MSAHTSAGSYIRPGTPAPAKIQLAALVPQTGRVLCPLQSHCCYVTRSPQETWPCFHFPPQGALTVDS